MQLIVSKEKTGNKLLSPVTRKGEKNEEEIIKRSTRLSKEKNVSKLDWGSQQLD